MDTFAKFETKRNRRKMKWFNMKIEITNLFRYWKPHHFHFTLFGYEKQTNVDNSYTRLFDYGYKYTMVITLLNIRILIRWGK